jgi:hypothetical protein
MAATVPSSSTMLRIFSMKNRSIWVASQMRPCRPEAHQLGDGVEPVVGAVADVFQQLLPGPGVELGPCDVAHADLQRAHGLEHALLDGAAHGHDLAGGLHLRGQVLLASVNLSKGKRGIFITT